ncbi:MAG: hypothetical protein ACREQH_13850 [Candidatus Binatus sp.]
MTEKTKKAFWKSKGFWGGLGSILTGLSIIFTTGHVSSDAILAIGTGGLAIYGRVAADAPLAISDRAAAAVEEAKADMRKNEIPVDADRGN